MVSILIPGGVPPSAPSSVPSVTQDGARQEESSQEVSHTSASDTTNRRALELARRRDWSSRLVGVAPWEITGAVIHGR